MHQNITLKELDFIARTNFASGQWQPMILLGAPGSGKTTWVTERLPELYAEALGIDASQIGLVIERPARRDAAEIAGVALPYKKDDGTLATQFTEAPLIGKTNEQVELGFKHGILLWDELAAARDPEQKVARDSFDPAEHSIGGEKIPAGWIVIGTGNRAMDKAGSGRLMSHLINVAMVFNVAQDVPGWGRWAEDHDVNPVAIECALGNDGFFADAVPAEDSAFCTPRSLVKASQHLDAFMESDEFTGSITPLMEKMLASNIGPAAANTLSQWIAQRGHIPTADEIMANPEGCNVPDQTGFQMIAANIAIGAVTDARTAEAALHYIVRLRPDLQVSLGVKLMRISTRSGWTVTDPLASAFIEKFHSLLPLATEG